MLKVAILALCVAACFAAAPKKYVRPCKYGDLGCVRDNFAANSKCNKKVSGAIPSEYKIPTYRFETPYFNASYIDEDLVIGNHDKCVVSEFFFNTVADSAVLGIDCPWLSFKSNRKLLQHYSMKEDSVYSYKINGQYPLIRLTVQLPHANNLDLCSAFVFADVTALPIFKIDPNDMPTQKFLSKDLSFLNIYERETFFYRGPALARYFVNSYICDFGCN